MEIMADMFYFRSPVRPLTPKYRHDFRHELKASKHRQTGKMGSRTPRACVARIEEPEFCASGLDSFIPQHSAGLDHTISIVRGRDVELQPNTTEERREVGDATELDYRTHAVSGFIDAAPIPPYEGIPLSRIGHPRPESHEIAQEEDGRRLRFALEDASEYPSLLQRLLHLEPTQEASDHHSTGGGNSDEQDGSFHPHSASTIPTIYANGIDDDALSVDDPRRSYDFKEWIQRYHCNDESQLDLSSFFPGSLEDVQRDELGYTCNGVDIQGLRWETGLLERRRALEARKQQHPFKRHVLPYRRSMNTHPSTLAERQYHHRTTLRRHRAHHVHYQLRNVLAATSRNDVFYSTGSRVIHTSITCPSIENTVMDLSKTPTFPSGMRVTCLSTTTSHSSSSSLSEQYLVAGGFGGEYALLNLTTPNHSTPVEGFMTHDYNGLVTHVSTYHDRRSGLPRACFCSNDRRIRLLDLQTNTFLNAFPYENAANCSALSPDGRIRVLVGDSNDTLLADAEKGNILLTLSHHQDHGFSCAWSDDGRHVATGSQDGKVVLWDSRNWSLPVQTMECVMASPRSLQFTSDGALVVGEDDDVVTIYECKRAEGRQDIRFFGSVAGVALLGGGEELVIANGDKTVGGIMSFRRTAQGLRGASLGSKVENGWRRKGGSRDSAARTSGHRTEIVSELVV